MNKTLKAFIDQVPGETADNLLVGETMEAMQARLAECRDQGKGGWHNPSTTTESLMTSLVNELSTDNPNMIDIINFAAMIRMRKELYGEGN